MQREDAKDLLPSPLDRANARRTRPRVAAIVPCFRVKRHIDAVVEGLRDFVDHVFVVDDCCPEGTGEHVASRFEAAWVTVIRHASNQGVGGAVLSGYRAAASLGYEILVKIDGDEQMDPAYIPALVAPIMEGRADYTKGNRFFDPRALTEMPGVRRFGNAVLSFLNKVSSGYWDVMDPTNGFTAIHAAVLRWLPLDRMERRYFFESDLLFRLGCARAAIVDVPMPPCYGNERSNLNVGRAALEFPGKHLSRFAKRIFYSYFLRGFNAGTVLLLAGVPLLTFGVVYGAIHWWHSIATGHTASTGVVMLAALPTLLGVQCLIGFLSMDVGGTPHVPIWPDSARLPVA